MQKRLAFETGIDYEAAECVFVFNNDLRKGKVLC